MKSKSASIIVTSYNYARFLQETIDSALAQTYRDCEVIVVDDGSTDNSRDIICSYAERVIPVIKENGGQASAFNAGFAASRGDVVFFLDSDDVLSAHAVETAMPLFDEPAVVKVHWPLWLMDACSQLTGDRLPNRVPPQGDFRDIVLRDGPYYDWNCIPPTTGNAWTRGFLDAVLPMPEPEYRICADEYLFSLAPVCGLMRTVAEPLGCYRAHGSNNGWRKRLSDDKVKADMLRFEYSCQMLAAYLQRDGERADPNVWLQRNWNYQWMVRLQKAKQDLLSVIPVNFGFVLVDGGDWGGQLLENRHAIPFVERDGQYWGPPENDASAIREMERLCASGAEFIVVWWTAFWWLDNYAGLHAYLNSRFERILSNDRLIVFRAPPQALSNT